MASILFGGLEYGRRTNKNIFSQLLLSGTFVHVAPFEVLQEKYGVNIQPNVVVLVSMDRYPDLAEENRLNGK